MSAFNVSHLESGDKEECRRSVKHRKHLKKEHSCSSEVGGDDGNKITEEEVCGNMGSEGKLIGDIDTGFKHVKSTQHDILAKNSSRRSKRKHRCDNDMITKLDLKKPCARSSRISCQNVIEPVVTIDLTGDSPCPSPIIIDDNSSNEDKSTSVVECGNSILEHYKKTFEEEVPSEEGSMPPSSIVTNLMDVSSEPTPSVSHKPMTLEQPWKITASQHQNYIKEWHKYVSLMKQRGWEYTTFSKQYHDQKRKKRGINLEFTIASYNMLSQDLLEGNFYLYKKSDRSVLQWEYRKWNLLGELKNLQPDVMCLQEVNATHYEDFYLPNLKNLGYNGVFKKRTGDKEDGCATFFKTDQFELEQAIPVEYYKPQTDLLDRDNIGLIILLRPIIPKCKSSTLCVANTHLLFNPRRGDIKLAQLMVLFAEIDKVACYHNQSNSPDQPSYCPIILAGDMNASPHSHLYNFIGKGELKYEGLLAKIIAGEEEQAWRGRDNYLDDILLDPGVGISDQCQFVEVVKARQGEFIRNKIKKRNRRATFMEDHSLEGGPIIAMNCHDPHSSSEGSEEATWKQPLIKRPPQTDCFIERADPRCDAPPVFTQGSGRVSHKLNLLSVYEHEKRASNGKLIKEVTTHHGLANCTVDYIFYSVLSKQSYVAGGKLISKNVNEGRLKLVGKLNLLSDQNMNSIGTLPNDILSSDHTVLMSKFLWCLK